MNRRLAVLLLILLTARPSVSSERPVGRSDGWPERAEIRMSRTTASRRCMDASSSRAKHNAARTVG